MIGTTLEKEEKREKVNLVNLLIEESFGKNFSGDWFFDKGFERKDKLNIVRRKGSGGSFKRGKIPYSGQFNNENGSVMTVFPKHYISALKYAVLYKEATGEKVEIKINKLTY